MRHTMWIVVGLACGLATLTVLGMSCVHHDWTAGNRLLHLAMAVAFGAAGGECLRRGLSRRRA